MPVVGVVATMVGWGIFAQSRTGYFALGPSASSFNGLNLQKGNSEAAIAMYPQRNLDEIPYSSMAPPAGSAKTEWDVDRFHQAEARTFIREQPGAFWTLVGRRAAVAFLEIRKTGLQGDEKPGLDKGMVALRPFLLFALGLAIGRLLSAALSGQLRLARLEIAFLVVLGAYLLPFLAGFIYYRHLVPVATVSGVYLLAAHRKSKTS